MSDEESKLSRREFIKFTAVTSVSAGGLYALTSKTDVLAQAVPPGPGPGGEDMHSYSYSNGPP